MDHYGFIFFLSFVVSITSLAKCDRKCKTDDNCPFGGTCVIGTCRCTASCRSAGVIPLCGGDGKFYLNYCYLQMHSCEMGREIEIVFIGYHEHCRSHPLAQYASMSTGFRYNPCNKKNNMCQNYGVCIADRGTPACLCPTSYHGQRCQMKHAPLFGSRRRHSAVVNPNVPEKRRAVPAESLVVLLLFCFLSATVSAIVTSAVCQRLRIRDIRQRTKAKWNPGEGARLIHSRGDQSVIALCNDDGLPPPKNY